MGKRLKALVVVALVIAILFGGCAVGWQQGKKIELPLMVRDLAIAYIAEKKAGEEIPFEPDYSLSQFYNVWGMITNSVWLAEQVRLIVPWFEYENVNERPNYPNAVFFQPLPGYQSFHILGLAHAAGTVSPDDPGVVYINERFMLEGFRSDQRQILATLVHELTHHQRGNFLGKEPNWLTGEEFEANTQSATIEVLAAMCNYKNEIACKAFWDEVYSYSRGSFRMRLRRWGLEQLYYPIADLLWWDDVERQHADKNLRYWMNDEDRKNHLYSIIYSYQQRPWEYVVLPGVLGTPMDTGLEGKCEVTSVGIRCEPFLMPFDDTADLLGDFVLWLIRVLK